MSDAESTPGDQPDAVHPGPGRRRIARPASARLPAAEVRWLRRALLAWGREHYQPYPWRAETSPWLTLVAEVLLQRTRAKQVEPVFANLQTRYPAAIDLVRAGTAATNEITARLGIHWRGPLLDDLARIVAARGGEPPADYDELRAIRGIGPYTAAAWLSLHRGTRAVIVDANVARWLARYTGLPYERDPRPVHWVKDLADQLTPPRAFRAWNYAVLDFTMLVCVPRTPRCEICPLARRCHEGRTRLGLPTPPPAAS